MGTYCNPSAYERHSLASGNKALVRMAVGKGRLLRATNGYLASLGLEPIDEHSRKLTHTRELEKCVLEISLFRWEDIKSYTNDFDLLIYGADQWLESGKKSMITLKSLSLNNNENGNGNGNGSCRLSLLVPEDRSNESLGYFLNRKIKVATGYPNLAMTYLGINRKDIVVMSGSVESAIHLGWASSIFDVVESGETAKANGLVEYKAYLEFGATLATTKGELIPFFQESGLIGTARNRITIAFDGLDGSGKTTLAKHFVQMGTSDLEKDVIVGNKGNGNCYPLVLVQPYSGYIGHIANSLLKSGNYFDWAKMVGQNHWRAPQGINGVYDRSVMTCLTELIRNDDTSDNAILEALDKWKPLPDIIFYCSIPVQEAYERVGKRNNKDSYDSIDSLMEYVDLYERAYEFISKYSDRLQTRVIKINTNRSIPSVMGDVRKHILELSL